MAYSLNKVQLIGNLTRDPELRYTPSGTAVCSFGIATNRQWTNEQGEKTEDVEFHRVVAWSKLAEICAQLLSKGRKVYIEGRLQTRKWTGQDEVERQTTEIVINEMIALDPKGAVVSQDDYDVPDDFAGELDDVGVDPDKKTAKKTNTKKSDKKVGSKKSASSKKSSDDDEDLDDDDIPF